MKAVIERIFSANLVIKPHECVLIITDEGMRTMAARFLQSARALGYETRFVEIPVAAVHGVEPTREVANEMLAADVILIITSKSLSHTRARADATIKGARIATMAGIREDILLRFAQVDLKQMKTRTNELADILDKGSNVLVTSARGTDLKFSISGRIAHGRKASVFDRPGYWGNIPCGEAFIAPLEESVSGRLVIDASIAGIGLVDEDVLFDIERGKVVTIRGGESARRFLMLLDEPRKRQVAEFGIGTNDKAHITGATLEDEKALGTCHIGFGNNVFFGGVNRVDFHADCVMRFPAIEVDGRAVEIRREVCCAGGDM